MRPFLVVEDERLALGAAQEEGATGHSGVARPGTRVGIAGSATGNAGSGIAERLARVEERLAVHVLVKGRQAIEVARMVAERPARETGQHRLLRPRQVREGFLPVGEWQVPPDGVGNGRGVVEAVGVGEQRRARRIESPKSEVVVKPGDVARRPEERIDAVEARGHELLVGEPIDQAQGPRVRVDQYLREDSALQHRPRLPGVGPAPTRRGRSSTAPPTTSKEERMGVLSEPVQRHDAGPARRPSSRRCDRRRQAHGSRGRSIGVATRGLLVSGEIRGPTGPGTRLTQT